MYIPWMQRDGDPQPSSFAYIVRAASGDPRHLAGDLRQVVRDVDPALRLSTARPYNEFIAESIGTERIMATLGGMFGALALLVAALGLFGLLAFQVARRTNELGVRMALGADRAGVLRLVLGRIVALVALGLAVGLPAAIGGSRLVASQLFGVGAIDPMSIGAAIVALVVVAAVSGFVPALRATRISPVQALRGE